VGGGSVKFQGLLAYFLHTTIPNKKNIMLCHACSNCKCSNVKHLYWGTGRENVEDSILAGTHSSIRTRTINKLGIDEANKILKVAQSNGGKNNKGKPKTVEHKRKISISMRGGSSSKNAK
jgi:hypothetical protein